MIQITITKDDQGNLGIQSTAPPYVVIGELAQAIALLTAQLSAELIANARRVIPGNGLMLPPRNQG